MASVTVAAILLGSRTPRRMALAALASLCRPVVVSAETDRAREELAGLPVELFVSEGPRPGLEAALASTPHLDAALFIRCDQTFVSAGSIRRLLDAFQRTRLPIAASRYGHKIGLPAVFSRTLFSQVLSGSNLNQIIHDHSNQVVTVPMPEAASNPELAEMRN